MISSHIFWSIMGPFISAVLIMAVPPTRRWTWAKVRGAKIKLVGAFTVHFGRHNRVIQEVADKVLALEEATESLRTTHGRQWSEIHRLGYYMLLLMDGVEVDWDLYRQRSGLVCRMLTPPYELFTCAPSKKGGRLVVGREPDRLRSGFIFEVWLPDAGFRRSGHAYGRRRVTVGQGFYKAPNGRTSFVPEESDVLEAMVDVFDAFAWPRSVDRIPA